MKNIIVKLLHLLNLYRVAKAIKHWWIVEIPWKRFYSNFIKKGDLCFDVGAHLGELTEIFVKLGSIVVAVEPQEVCIKQLRQKYGNNNRVTII